MCPWVSQVCVYVGSIVMRVFLADGQGLKGMMLLVIGLGSGLVLVAGVIIGVVVVCCRRRSAHRSKKGLVQTLSYFGLKSEIISGLLMNFKPEKIGLCAKFN